MSIHPFIQRSVWHLSAGHGPKHGDMARTETRLPTARDLPSERGEACARQVNKKIHFSKAPEWPGCSVFTELGKDEGRGLSPSARIQETRAATGLSVPTFQRAHLCQAERGPRIECSFERRRSRLPVGRMYPSELGS